MAQPHKIELKTISSSGQISLGKAHAGKHIQLEQLEDGRWIITPVQVIPEHLQWVHTPEVTARLERHLAWAKNHSPQDTDLKVIEAVLQERS
jgi:CRISPR/Cas system CMR subunit Cmr4 (Cas7 group RAMP superfamily)